MTKLERALIAKVQELDKNKKEISEEVGTIKNNFHRSLSGKNGKLLEICFDSMSGSPKEEVCKNILFTTDEDCIMLDENKIRLLIKYLTRMITDKRVGNEE